MRALQLNSVPLGGQVKTAHLGIVLAVALIGCGRGETPVTTFTSAESAARYVQETPLPSSGFTLAISDAFTFAGRPDTIGAGMAVVLDAVLANGFVPDGFVQKDGFRLYKYKRAD